jgi:sporulation protein YlmC with PRC-barrel domain
MPETERFTIGADVSCTDGPCGTLTRVVVEPITHLVTHLIVEPRGQGPARLVPLELVGSAASEIQLRCASAQFDRLDPAAAGQFITNVADVPDYRTTDVVAWPHFSYRGAHGYLETADTIPPGEVEVQRGEHVNATDGHIGQVEGLVIDPDSHRVTHVLLQEGHLWDRKQVAIPIGAVTRVAERIEVNLTKQQVQDLPEVDIDRPQG